MAVTKLVLVRRRKPVEQENRFTGWYDVDLSDKGPYQKRKQQASC